MWLGKLTALNLTPLGWLGRKTSTQTKPTELWCLLAPPNSNSILVFAMKDFGTTVFTESPVLADIPTQFFYGIWACTPFPHSDSVLCRCPYKERIVRQTTIARTPSHRSVDDCCLALPPRLWQPRNPEGGEATVIERQPHIPTLMLSVTAGCSFTSYPGPLVYTVWINYRNFCRT